MSEPANGALTVAGFEPGTPGVTPPRKRDRNGVFLTDVIVELGLASQEAIDIAERNARDSGRTIEQALLEREVLDERQLAMAVAERSGLDFVDLDVFEADLEVATLIDRSAARRYRMVPIALAGDGALVVACRDPFDSLGLSDVEQITRSEVRRVISTSAAVDALIEQLPEAPFAAAREPLAWTEAAQADEAPDPEPDETPDATWDAAPVEAPVGQPVAAPPQDQAVAQHAAPDSGPTAEEAHVPVPPGPSPEPAVAADVAVTPASEPVVRPQASQPPPGPPPGPNGSQSQLAEQDPFDPPPPAEAPPPPVRESVAPPPPAAEGVVPPPAAESQVPPPPVPEGVAQSDGQAALGGPEVDDLSAELRTLSETAMRAETLAAEWGRRIEELGGAEIRIERLEEERRGAEQRITELERELAASEARVAELEQRLSGVTTAVEKLRNANELLQNLEGSLEAVTR